MLKCHYDFWSNNTNQVSRKVKGKEERKGEKTWCWATILLGPHRNIWPYDIFLQHSVQEIILLFTSWVKVEKYCFTSFTIISFQPCGRELPLGGKLQTIQPYPHNRKVTVFVRVYQTLIQQFFFFLSTRRVSPLLRHWLSELTRPRTGCPATTFQQLKRGRQPL